MVVAAVVVDAMAMTGHGYDPVAQFDELNGDLFAHLDGIATNLPDDYAIVTVVHGDVYLCKVVDHGDAYWRISGEIGPGKTGSWDSASDKFAQHLSDGEMVVDELGGQNRYLVYERDD